MKEKDWLIFIGDLAGSYSRRVLRGVSQALEMQPALRAYAVYHVGVDEMPKLDVGDVAGALVGSVSRSPAAAKELAKWKIPMVSVAGDQEIPWLPWRVRTDDDAVGQSAAAHLLDRGFQRFGYLGHDGHLAMTRRRESFVSAIRSKGYSVDCFQGAAERVARRWWPPGMLEWIHKVEKPAAVFCGNDLRANAMLVACRRAGIRVPEEIAVLGVDDDDVFATLQHPHISTVAIPAHIIAQTALQILLQLIEGKTPPQRLLLLPPDPIITRGSTDILAVEDDLVREALAYIHGHLAKGVSIKRMAAELAVSRPTLEKRFASALGRSPAAELRRLQLERTKVLLANTELDMEQVASRVGFSSAQQMSVSFKRFVGVAPTEYRKAHCAWRRRDVNT